MNQPTALTHAAPSLGNRSRTPSASRRFLLRLGLAALACMGVGATGCVMEADPYALSSEADASVPEANVEIGSVSSALAQPLASSTVIAIRTEHYDPSRYPDTFVANGAANAVTLLSQYIDTDERWTMELVGQTPEQRAAGRATVAFKGSRGKYMAVHGTTVTAGAPSIGKSEQFEVRAATPWTTGEHGAFRLTYSDALTADSTVVIKAPNGALLSTYASKVPGGAIPGLLLADGLEDYYPPGGPIGLDRTLFFQLRAAPPAPYNRTVAAVCAGDQVGNQCYAKCQAGYEVMGGSPGKCIEVCPSDYRNDGLTCFRDARIKSANNSRCPALDKCGLKPRNRGCSICPAGWRNDGCTCRLDAYAFGKNSYARPSASACPTGASWQSNECRYECRISFRAVGNMCFPQ